ncbi:MAG TPA: DUF2497 domain-containing protein, partial [Rhodobiaceae bacterium]|nr:DUF2497 domain-containing protein [Rhodobiaceae bacterium]
MSNQGQAQEPTMEEILASIRRIISEDSGPEDEAPSASAEAAPPPPADPVPAPEPVPEPAAVEPAVSEPAAGEEDDILELTEALPDEAAPEE